MIQRKKGIEIEEYKEGGFAIYLNELNGSKMQIAD